MQEIRRLIRWVASGCTTLLTLAFFPVVSEFIIELLREKGFYERPSERMEALMATMSVFVTQTWFVALTTFFIGLSLGLWVDTIMRWREKTESEPAPLEIRFDPSNPGHRFWSDEYWNFPGDGSCSAPTCRVEIKNNTATTIRGVYVEVTDHSDGKKARARFTRTGEHIAEINPGASELVSLFPALSKSARAKVTIYAGAIDIPQVAKTYRFDSSAEPVLIPL
jgi:hypothetical protein